MVRARVLVSDAETPAALAVVRSLARAGHAVAVLAHSRHAPAAASRHRRAVVRVPDPLEDPDGWARETVRATERGRFDVLVPVTDAAGLLAARAREELSGLVRLALPPAAAHERALEKTEVLDRASGLGIPVLSRFEDDRVSAVGLPAVVKPRRSRALVGGRIVTATARVVGSRAALRRETERLRGAGLGAYVEPWVPGEARGIFLLLSGGDVLARFAHRRVREASPLGGPSAVCESVRADPALLRHAEALARDLGIEGPFMAEFRGETLLEVNARYWGSLALAIEAGVDFPALHVAALLGERVRGPVEWRTGVRVRNLAFDARRAARVLRGRPGEIDVPWPGRGRALADLALERAGGMVLDRSDPAPGRARLLMLLGKVVGDA